MAFANPGGVLNNMTYLVDAFMNYTNPPEKLKIIFKELLFEYRKSLSDN